MDNVAQDFDQLEGLLHPIRRAPDDILRYIFEWAAHMTPWPTRVTPLSQVCGQWRTIAISTPSLWTYISPPLHKDRSIVSTYWKLAAERIKSLPANVEVSINEFDPPSNINGLLSSCPLNQIQNISSLDLWADETLLVHLLTWLPTQVKPVRHVILHSSYMGWGYNPLTFVDISVMASTLSPTTLRSASLDVSIPKKWVTPALPTVCKLAIKVTGGSSHLHHVFQVFPSLESLEMIRWDVLRVSSPNLITLHRLCHLEILGLGFPWGLKFRCPLLETIYLSETELTPDLLHFLSIHEIRKIAFMLLARAHIETISTASSKLDRLSKLTKTAEDETPPVLALRIELLQDPDSDNELDSYAELEGLSWSLVTDDLNRRFREYLWERN